MRVTRRSGAGFGALLLLVLSSCTDAPVVAPEQEVRSDLPFAVLDGSTSGTPDFFFLPPIVPNAPTLVGEFNPDLAPAIRICELDGGPVPTSTCKRVVDEFPSGSIEVLANSYRLDWNPRNNGIRSSRFYRLEVIVADSVFGYVDLDPIGGGQDDAAQPFDAETYAFQFRPRSQSVPVEFFLSVEAFCEGEIYVTECITGVAVNQEGANIALDNEGNRLGVIIAQNALPAPFEEVLVTLERINPVDYLAATGQECIPGLSALGAITGDFDAPQFGDCFRVETVPELTNPLLAEAVVSICLEVTSLNLTQQQIEQIRMVKFSDADQDWTALQETVGDCPTQQASLFDVPDQGFFRYAAMGANALAGLVLPEPVEARDIRFGGFNSSFSRFRFALPGQMAATEGDGTIIQSSDDNTIDATITVLDAGDDLGQNRQPVEGARVRFTPDAGAGTVSANEVITGADGTATVQWTVDDGTPGEKVLTASALGLFGGPIPDPDGVEYNFVAESVTFTATVVGPPSELTQDPVGNIDDAVAGEPQPLSITVTDAGGNLVEGALVTWTCSPTCSFGEGTQNPDGSATITAPSDASGVASVDWTALSAGSQVSVASIEFDVPDVTFTATVSPSDAVEPTYPTVPESGVAGEAVNELSLQVTDEFGNPRAGDIVTWTIVSGDGSVSESSTTTDVDGFASTIWTLGQTAGLNELTITTASFSTTISIEGGAAPPVQPIGQGGGQDGTVATALGTPLSFTLVDAFGNTIAGEGVTWSGDGSFSPESTTTDAFGVAQTVWTLGQGAGAQSASASVAGFTVEYAATAAPGEAIEPTYTAVPSTDVVATTLEGITATVTDLYANAREGDAVTWEVTAGGGSVSLPTGVTDVSGAASTSWTLGTQVGENQLQVTIGAFTNVFTVNTTPDAPVQPAGTGSGQNGTVGQVLATPISITLVDQYGNAISGETVTFSGPGAFAPSSTTTNASGQASAAWTLGNAAVLQTASASVAGFTVDFEAVANPGAPTFLTPSGSGAIQTVGTDVELGVTVTDLYGNPVPDQFVTWSGDGTFSPAVGTSPNGMTAVTWTLGTTAGEQSAAVAIDGLTATYVATATPDAAVSVAQTGAGGEYDPATALPLSITVTDQFGNTRDGDAVTWSTNSGTVAGDAATSNGGLANASWTLGNEAGDFTATAMVEGLTAIFNATVKGCTVDVDGMVDADEWSCALDDGDYFDFEANVSGGATPAQVRWQQRADSIYFLVLVEQGSLANKNNLRIDIDNTLNGATGDDDVIGYDEQTGFYDDYLTNRCANRSQAGCSSTDSNGQDGAGALGNDGTYTVYEISHPLNGDGAQDISVSPGDTFGFFLSLTNGNGAQGNTQVPAFRVYQDVVVR